MRFEYSSTRGVWNVSVNHSNANDTTKDLNEEVFNFDKNTPLSPTKKTKRHVGYYTCDDEEIAERAREDLKKMRIDGEETQ